MNNIRIASLLLRIGLAFSFLYAALSSFTQPMAWIGFFPLWLRHFVPDPLLLGGFSVVEAALALWLLSGWKTFYASLLSALLIAGIVIFNIAAFEITFRDVTIFFAALALASLTRYRHAPRGA